MTENHVRFLRSLRLISVFAALIAANPAHSQETQVVRIDLAVGRSYPIRTAENVTRVSIATPEVADVIVISEREVVINALKSGETDAIVWLQTGDRTHYCLQVHTPSDRPQVALAVKFAEVRRDALREIGISALFRDDRARVGTGIFRTDDVFNLEKGTIELPSASRFFTVLSDLGTDDLLAFLDAEEQRGRARFLAEPNLLAANRETATFLAGGELPIPIAQGGTGQGNTPVTIQYKEFGIRLRFIPEIVSDSLIKLTVAPEVSNLDFGNAILLQGFRIPAFRTRRMESTLDVKRDQSLIISGLFADEEERVKTGIPFLKDIPILGQLFSSTRFQRLESELIVVVTPVIIDPNRPRSRDVFQFPPDTTRPATDALRRRRP